MPATASCSRCGTLSDDLICFADVVESSEYPFALQRGEYYGSGTSAGPFTLDPDGPGQAIAFLGFRCGR